MQRKHDLTNTTIHNIHVLYEIDPVPDGRGFPRRKWHCKCLLCNNEFDIFQQNLLNDNSKSCGCAKSKSLIGQRFGKLVVTGEDYSKVDARGHRIKRWICKCDCGAVTKVVTQKLNSGRVRSCGCIKSHGEELISNLLKENNIRWKPQYSFSDLVSDYGNPLMFDFGILDDNGNLSYLIEYQGIQHDKIMGPQGYGKQQKYYTDPQKKKYCKDKHIPLYEIWYNEDIQEKLSEILHGNVVPVAS